jgi:hypothetical protein
MSAPTPPASTPPLPPPPPTGAVSEADAGPSYPGWFPFVAFASAVFFPFISAVVGFVLLAGEKTQARRRQLKIWAFGSVMWLLTGYLVLISVILGVGHALHGCKGGIDRLSVPTYYSSDGTNWTARYACYDGGSKVVKVPASEVPGAGS